MRRISLAISAVLLLIMSFAAPAMDSVISYIGTNNGMATQALVDASGRVNVLTESTKATFSVVVPDVTPVATATDLLTISGSATKTIRINKIEIEGVATAQADYDVYVYKRTAANTGGTSAAPSNITAHDSNDTATAGVLLYTANATGLGTGTLVRAGRTVLGVAGTGVPVKTTWDFGTRNDKTVVLRGAAQSLAINLGGAAVPAGTSLYVNVEWTEE